MVTNRYLGDFDTMLRLTMLCRKLHKCLDLNRAILYISEEQRYNLYLKKARVYTPSSLKKVEDAIKQLTGASNIEVQGEKLSQPEDVVASKYQSLLELIKTNPNAVDEKTVRQIKCDLQRTNTTDRVKTRDGQIELENLLLAIACVFP